MECVDGNYLYQLSISGLLIDLSARCNTDLGLRRESHSICPERQLLYVLVPSTIASVKTDLPKVYMPPSIQENCDVLFPERRSVPKDPLPVSLQASYPCGYNALILGISLSGEESNATPSIKYFTAPKESGCGHEVMIVVLDETQESLPNNPTWDRFGRFCLLDNLSATDLIESLKMRELQRRSRAILLLPETRDGEEVVGRSLVQVWTLAFTLASNTC